MTNKRPARVLIVIGKLNVGGVEMDLVRNLPAIDRERFAVSVYTFQVPGELAPLLRDEGIEVYSPDIIADDERCGCRGNHFFAVLYRGIQRLPLLRFAIFYLRIIYPLVKHIRNRKIDVVHCFLPNAYLCGTTAALLAGQRNIVMSRVSLNRYQQHDRFHRIIERYFLHRFARVAIGNSKRVLNELLEEGIPLHRLYLLKNGIDPAPFAPSAEKRARSRAALGLVEEDFVLTIVANLHRYKGHADLFHGLAQWHDKLPLRWRLLVAGGGSAERVVELQHLIAQLNLGEHVRLLGLVEDVPALLAASDLHVLASHEEGLPNSVLEAMAAGLPLVATRVGGVPEAITDGENGLLVDAQDAHGLGEAVARLAADGDLRRAMGLRNIQRVESQFSLRRSVSQYEDVYGKLTGA